jgi:hypothetical protein
MLRFEPVPQRQNQAELALGVVAWIALCHQEGGQGVDTISKQTQPRLPEIPRGREYYIEHALSLRRQLRQRKERTYYYAECPTMKN